MENNTKEIKYKSIPRSEKNVKDIQSRLNRIMGQVGGIKKMVEDGRYCADILIQISACEKALASISDIILKEHLESCVVSCIKAGDLDIVPETMDLIKKIR